MSNLISQFLLLHSLDGVRIMTESGVNVDIFGSHSTRAALTSKCKAAGLSFKEISKSAGWSTERSFALYYDKPTEDNFSEIVFL